MPKVSLRELRRRIRAIEGITQITNAMKMVALARLQKAKRYYSASLPYIEAVTSATEEILFPSLKHPFFQQREVKRGGVIVITSERGLCGGFNLNIFREMESLKTSIPNLLLFVVGRVGQRYFRRLAYPIKGEFPSSFPPRMEDALPLAQAGMASFLSGEIDVLYVVYTHFREGGLFLPVARRLLPLENKAQERDFIFEPPVEELLEHLLPHYITVFIYRALWESTLSEQTARATSMDMATQNAQSLLQDLRIEYNKLRQELITNEISEIVRTKQALEE